MLRRALDEADNVACVSALAMEVAHKARETKEMLNVYIDRLNHADVRKASSSPRIVGLSRADVRAEVTLQDFEQRLNVIAKSLTCSDDVRRMTSEFKRLMIDGTAGQGEG